MTTRPGLAFPRRARAVAAATLVASSAALVLGGTRAFAVQPSLAGISDPALRHAAQVAAPSLVEIDMELTGALRDRSNGSISDTYQLGFSGSGFFASQDGYVVTAAHVAAPTPDQVHEALVNAQIDVQHNCQRTSTEACDRVEQQYRDQMINATEVVDSGTAVHVVTQDTGAGDGLVASVVATSSSDQTDVAVLKVDIKDAPVVLLSTSAPARGRPIAVLGYPESTADTQVALVPVVTDGVVQDVRPGDPGFAAAATVLQTNAHIEHGDSGGPGIDAGGSALGIVSYGPSVDRNFMVSAADILSLLRHAGADNALGSIDRLWRDGLDAAARGDTATALRLLRQCAALNVVQVGCSDEAATLSGEPTQPPRAHGSAPAETVVQRDTAVTSLVVGLAIGLVLGIAGTLVVVRVRRRHGVPPPWPAQMPQGWWPGAEQRPGTWPPPVWPPPAWPPPPPPPIGWQPASSGAPPEAAPNWPWMTGPPAAPDEGDKH
jgi:S1-C subfamily serine protease